MKREDMKIGSSSCFTGSLAEEMLAPLAKAGLDYLEYTGNYIFYMRNCDFPKNAEKILETVRKAGLEPWSFHLPFSRKLDISNMMSCMTPLASEMVLYRNIKTKFMDNLEEGMSLNYLGFSSCSLSPHIAENATYGSSGCTLVEIIAPAGTPAIRLDLLPDVQNEPDEVILAPIEFLVGKIDRESGKTYMICKSPL